MFTIMTVPSILKCLKNTITVPPIYVIQQQLLLKVNLNITPFYSKNKIQLYQNH